MEHPRIKIARTLPTMAIHRLLMGQEVVSSQCTSARLMYVNWDWILTHLISHSPPTTEYATTTNLLYQEVVLQFQLCVVSIREIIVKSHSVLIHCLLSNSLIRLIIYFLLVLKVYVDVGVDNSPVTLSVVTSGPTYVKPYIQSLLQ